MAQTTTTLTTITTGYSAIKRITSSWPLDVYDIEPVYINSEQKINNKKFNYFLSNLYVNILDSLTLKTNILSSINDNSFNLGDGKFVYTSTTTDSPTSVDSILYSCISSRRMGATATFSFTPSSLYINKSQDSPVFSFISTRYASTLSGTSAFACLVIPESLFLYPINAINNGSNYTLQLNTVLLSSYIKSYRSSRVANEAYIDISNFLYNKPITGRWLPLPSQLISYTISYDLSAYKYVNSRNLSNDIDINIPINNYVYLEPLEAEFKIRPFNTYVTYETMAVNPDFYELDKSLGETSYEIFRIGQYLPEVADYKSINPLIITKYDNNIDKDSLTLILSQSGIDPNYDISEVQNSSQYITLNLTSARLEHNLILNDKGIPLTKPNYLALSYKLDSKYFIENTSIDSRNSVSIAQNGTFVTYTLPYPPHYYSFNATYDAINSAGTLKPHTKTTLNFNLSTGVSKRYFSDPKSVSVSAVELSSYLFSDFNILKLDFDTFCKNDKIIFYSYLVTNNSPEVVTSAYLSALSCFYGPSLDVYYDLNNPTYIPAISASRLLITYPGEIYGEFNLFLASSLSCSNLTQIDIDRVLPITFAYGFPLNPYLYPINIAKIREIENRMDLSCAGLSADNLISTKDLTNSYISWSYAPTSKNVKIISINYDNLLSYTEIPTEIQIGESLYWTPSSNTICISGYDFKNITVSLSSQKYNEVAKINNVLSDYYYLNESELLINSSDIFRYETVRFSLSTIRNYFGTYVNIPSSIYIYWDYDYYNKDLVNIYYRGNKYKQNDVKYARDLSSIDVEVLVDYTNFSSQIQPLTFTVYMPVTNKTLSASYSNDIYLLPSDNLLNVDFNIQSQTLTSTNNRVYSTRNKENIISRPNSDLNKFIFIGNNDVLPNLKYESLNWNISTDSIYALTTAYSTTPQLSVMFSNIVNSYKISKAIITLSAYKAYLPNWLITKNLSASFTLNFLPKTQFINNFKFNIYPPYTWTTNSSGNLTLLNNSNYKTLLNSPTAYGNKKSNSQNFYISCNNVFDVYNFHSGSNLDYITTLTSTSGLSSFFGLIDIPYNNEFYSIFGNTISITAYKDNLYPFYDGATFVGMTSSGTEYTGYFPITASTLPYSSTYINTNFAFMQSPKLVEYDSTNLTFTVNKTAIDLDKNIFINITQKLSSLSINNPAKIFNDNIIQKVTYTLSSKYWNTYVDIPAVDGTYDLFILRVGDPSEVLTVKDSEILTMVITPSAYVTLKIPSTTFQNILTSVYNDDRDLWVEKNVLLNTSNPITLIAYSTSVKPDLFISSYFSTTGNNIFFQFETPENSLNYKISAYDLSFGDGLTSRVFNDSTIFKSYSSDGLYDITYKVYYSNLDSLLFKLDRPITIYKEWPSYNQDRIRLLTENQLYFGNEFEKTYTLDQIEIQPNEWGDVDIFNTAITRLQLNLDYLKYNIQTLNNNSPTLFYGWLGTHKDKKTTGISWYTQNYKKLYLNYPNNAISQGTSYFSNLKDIVETKDRFYVIDNTTIRAFSSSKIPQEIFFENANLIDELLINPTSIDVDETGENIYVSDSYANKIYKLNIDFDLYPPEMNIQLNVGGFGDRSETNKLKAPTELTYKKETLFVLDYNNNCIKQYTKDLNWMFTYYVDAFDTDQPITFTIHPETLMVYVLTQSFNVYIFDYFNSDVFEILNISDIDKKYTPLKIFFDEYGDFFYILNQKYIYKYTATGSFVTETILPNYENLNFVSGKSSVYRSILISTSNCILKYNDIVNLFKIGDGLSYSYWTENQLKLNKDDLALDVNYNISLNRVCQNIKQFRDILNSKFVLIFEKTNFGIVKYYSIYPISNKNKLKFSNDIENENLGVGVNEFHIPQVLNREFKKIYVALEQLRNYLEISDIRSEDGDITNGCTDLFCWSWKSMSCYSLSLPVIKICNINPITYKELESTFPSDYSYATSNTYGKATSDCCSSVKSPLET